MVDVSKISSYVRTPHGFRNLATGKFASAAELAAKRAGNLPVPISHYSRKSVPAVIEHTVEEVAKKPSMWKKAAKWGLIGLGIAGLIGAGVYLYKKYKDSKNQAPVNPNPTPVNPAPVKPTPKPVKPTPVKPTPVKQTPKPSETHIVRDGENLWNIAKQYLKDQHKNDPNYKPSNKEILAKTEELMKLNNKHYEQPLPSDSRKRVVIIKPNEQIKLN